MRMSDWSSDVCSSDLPAYHWAGLRNKPDSHFGEDAKPCPERAPAYLQYSGCRRDAEKHRQRHTAYSGNAARRQPGGAHSGRSEEHTSELQSLMRNSYAVFCLKKKNHKKNTHTSSHNITSAE